VVTDVTWLSGQMIMAVVVFVDVSDSVSVYVNSSHSQASAKSIETIWNSSPLSNFTSKLSQFPQHSEGTCSVVCWPHVSHCTTAGTDSICSSAPLTLVNSVTRSQLNKRASGTT
jgi:hypothetical protein